MTCVGFRPPIYVKGCGYFPGEYSLVDLSCKLYYTSQFGWWSSDYLASQYLVWFDESSPPCQTIWFSGLDIPENFTLAFWHVRTSIPVQLLIYDGKGAVISQFQMSDETYNEAKIEFSTCNESNPPGLISPVDPDGEDGASAFTFESTCSNIIRDCMYSESNWSGGTSTIEHVEEDMLYDPEEEDTVLYKGHKGKIIAGGLMEQISKKLWKG